MCAASPFGRVIGPPTASRRNGPSVPWVSLPGPTGVMTHPRWWVTRAPTLRGCVALVVMVVMWTCRVDFVGSLFSLAPSRFRFSLCFCIFPFFFVFFCFCMLFGSPFSCVSPCGFPVRQSLSLSLLFFFFRALWPFTFLHFVVVFSSFLLPFWFFSPVLCPSFLCFSPFWLSLFDTIRAAQDFNFIEAPKIYYWDFNSKKQFENQGETKPKLVSHVFQNLQTVERDFFLRGTMRHNQDEPIPLVFPSLLVFLCSTKAALSRCLKYVRRLQRNDHFSCAFTINHASI